MSACSKPEPWHARAACGRAAATRMRLPCTAKPNDMTRAQRDEDPCLPPSHRRARINHHAATRERSI